MGGAWLLQLIEGAGLWVWRQGLGIKGLGGWKVLPCLRSPVQPVSEALAALRAVRGQQESFAPEPQACAGP